MMFHQEDNPKEKPANDIAMVAYRIDKDGEFYVDVNIEDYSKETIQYLGSLIASIPTTAFQAQTMSIVKHAFMRDEKTEELERLIATVIIKSEKFLERLEKQCEEDEESTENQPCIKPSDML